MTMQNHLRCPEYTGETRLDESECLNLSQCTSSVNLCSSRCEGYWCNTKHSSFTTTCWWCTNSSTYSRCLIMLLRWPGWELIPSVITWLYLLWWALLDPVVSTCSLLSHMCYNERSLIWALEKLLHSPICNIKHLSTHKVSAIFTSIASKVCNF